MESAAQALASERHWISRLALPFTIAPHELHLWLVALDCPTLSLAGLRKLLPPDECERADRFLVDVARRAFVASRGALRITLSHYLQVDPQEIRFDYTEKGKPFLTSSDGANPIRFNLSHSGKCALIVIANSHEVGVDIELIQDRPDLYETAGRFFSQGEQALLERLPPLERHSAFYRIWTHKEAVLKAAGQGITAGLRAPDLTAATEPRVSGKASLIEHGGLRWLVQGLEPAPGYEGAVAVEMEP